MTELLQEIGPRSDPEEELYSANNTIHAFWRMFHYEYWYINSHKYKYKYFSWMFWKLLGDRGCEKIWRSKSAIVCNWSVKFHKYWFQKILLLDVMETFVVGNEQIRRQRLLRYKYVWPYLFRNCFVNFLKCWFKHKCFCWREKIGVGGDEQIRRGCCVTSTNHLLSSPAIDPSIQRNTNRNSSKYKHKYIRAMW